MSQSLESSPCIPVELIVTSGDLPFLSRGNLVEFGEGRYSVDCERPVQGVHAGASAIIDFRDGETPRLVVNVAEVLGQQVVCAHKAARGREYREFPRMEAGISVRFRVAADPSEVQRWLAGKDTPGGAWTQPDEFMNFSVAGLRFECGDVCRKSDVVLVEMGMPATNQRHRCTARVVRVDPISGWDRATLVPDVAAPPTHQVAIAFDEMPVAARDALSELTLRMQDALMDAPGAEGPH